MALMALSKLALGLSAFLCLASNSAISSSTLLILRPQDCADGCGLLTAYWLVGTALFERTVLQCLQYRLRVNERCCCGGARNERVSSDEAAQSQRSLHRRNATSTA